MGFSFFKSKSSDPVKYDYKFHDVFDEVVSFYQEKFTEDIEKGKERFVKLTGQFDEEHEYFESKLDDFRSWFLFLSGERLFQNLDAIKNDENLKKYYEFLTSGIFSVFTVQKVKDDEITLQDLASNKLYKVKDAVSALSMDKGSCLQTSVFYSGEGFYEFGPSIVVHPIESLKYIKKKIKEVRKGKGISKEELFERLMAMRYQFFKYKQLEVKQIYSDKSLLFEKISEVQG